jgi:DsbC/DsbD-like thiol-disulfide interchange protein
MRGRLIAHGAAAALLVAALVAAPPRPTPLGAQVPEPRVTAVGEFGAVPAGGAFRVAMRLDVPEGWGIDWVNPGTTGLPTTLTWRTPASLIAGPIEWPFPERHETGGEVMHLLRGTVYLVTPFRVASDARTGSAELRAELTWLLCSTTCIRQQRTVSVPVRIAQATAARSPATPSPAWTQVEAASGSFPVEGAAGVALHAVSAADSVRLEIAGLRGVPPAGSLVTFFPMVAGRAAVVAPIQRSAGGVAVALPATFVAGAPPGRLTGVLVGLVVSGPTHTSRALSVDVRVTGR